MPQGALVCLTLTRVRIDLEFAGHSVRVCRSTTPFAFVLVATAVGDGSLSPHASDAAAVSDREIYMEQPAETPFASRAREKQIENKLLVLRLELLSTLSSMDTGLGAKVNHEKTSVEFVGVEILASLPKVSLPELPGPFTAPYDSQ
eukprot:gene616-2047_t